ncbi:MAG: hypothetical protein GY855_07560 [candidate division Zixibacteria bacterium]|nr:hypothetical protein [candidate division Zixibacteria bacterium]
MATQKKLDERERAFRIELQKRVLGLNPRTKEESGGFDLSQYAQSKGDEISNLIYDENLEKARELLREELSKYPDELLFLNLQMTLDMIDKPFGSYEDARKIGYKLFELAVEKNNEYFTWVAINNIGIIVRIEGDEETAKLMFLTAHFINRQSLAPMQNLANWFSRKGLLEEAQSWIERILKEYPEWKKKEELITYFKFEEALNNLRSFEPFKEMVMSELN